MKKILTIAICSLMSIHPMLSFANQAPETTQELITGMANPFMDFKTLEEAEKKAGFDINLPNNIPSEYVATDFRAMVNGTKLIEVIYKNKNQVINFRKGIVENISGVYVKFTDNFKVEIADKTINLKGKDGKVQLATWSDGNFSYSINATSYNDADSTIGSGLLKEEMIALIQNMLTK